MPGLLDVTINVNGTPIRVLNTHLDYRANPAVRAAQVEEMLNVIDDSPLPTIVCGDMNAAPNAPELAPLLGRLHDAWTEANGSGFTYPAEEPTKRIDYILVAGRISVRSARVPETLASDHRPVVADLIVR
jgi:endonuclease/exonuclease/phosphatase family metal-dependent hydrolase